MTGWNLPPGCTTGDIDRAMGLDELCLMCWQYPDECECPECPVCHQYGDPDCYDREKGHPMGVDGFLAIDKKAKEGIGFSWNGEKLILHMHPTLARGARGRRTLWEIEEMVRAQEEGVFAEFYAEEKRLFHENLRATDRWEEMEAERLSDKWRER
jgi:hypothetical protein